MIADIVLKISNPAFWRRHRWPIVFGVVCATLIVSVVGTKVNSDRISRDAMQGAQTHRAVCALVDDLRDRYQNGVAYIRRHPGEFKPSDLAAFKRQLAGNLRTLRALEVLQCDR